MGRVLIAFSNPSLLLVIADGPSLHAARDMLKNLVQWRRKPISQYAEEIHELGNIGGGPREEIKNQGRKKKKDRAMILPLIKTQS